MLINVELDVGFEIRAACIAFVMQHFSQAGDDGRGNKDDWPWFSTDVTCTSYEGEESPSKSLLRTERQCERVVQKT